MTSTPATIHSETPISVVIVDDHEVVALGLAALLQDADGITVAGIATTGADALGLIEQVDPDVVLMDYRLSDGTGTEVAQELRDRGARPHIVMVTAVADRRVLSQALDAGCTGFLSKNSDRSDLIDAVTAAAEGESYFTRDVLKHLVHLRRFDEVGHSELSERECEVLQLTADGLFPDEVARELHLSPHTVKNHIRHAMAKLDAHTKLEAVVKAVRARLISIDDSAESW